MQVIEIGPYFFGMRPGLNARSKIKLDPVSREGTGFSVLIVLLSEQIGNFAAGFNVQPLPDK